MLRFLATAILVGLCLTVGTAVARPDIAALTAPQAVAAVKAVLRARAARCGTKVVRVSVARSARGWNVTAVTSGGAAGRSLWAVVRAPQPLNPLARRIVAGCPKAPAPARPGPPAPGAPASYTFGAELTASQQALVRRGLDAGARYYRSALGRELPAFGVWAYTTLEDMVAAYATTAPESPERARELWSGGQVGHAMTRKVWLGPKWFENTQQSGLKIAAHEAFHLLQYELVGARALSVSGLDEIPRAGPWWLAEGAAEYFAYLAVVADGATNLANVRAQWIRSTKASAATLNTLATLRGQRETAGAYDIYALATERLLSARDPMLTFVYYDAIARGVSWPEAFATTFGRAFEAFVDEFEAYRRSI